MDLLILLLPITHFFHFVAKVHVKMLHKAETFFYFDELWTVKMIPRTDKKDKVDLKVLTSMNSQLGTLTWEFCQESNEYLISFKKSSQSNFLILYVKFDAFLLDQIIEISSFFGENIDSFYLLSKRKEIRYLRMRMLD